MGTHVSFIFMCYNLPSLKLTVSLHLKNGWLEYEKVSFWGPAYVQGRLLFVSVRVYAIYT